MGHTIKRCNLAIKEPSEGDAAGGYETTLAPVEVSGDWMTSVAEPGAGAGDWDSGPVGTSW